MQESGAWVPAAAGAPSERVRLARVALESALAEDGVARAEPGPLGLRLTQGGGEVVQGVTAAVTTGRGYELSVYLVGRLVPLQPLGDRVRSAIEKAAASAGLADRLDAVHIRWEDVSLPGDPEPDVTPVGPSAPPPSTPPRPGSGAAAAAGSGAPPPAPGSSGASNPRPGPTG